MTQLNGKSFNAEVMKSIRTWFYNSIYTYESLEKALSEFSEFDSIDKSYNSIDVEKVLNDPAITHQNKISFARQFVNLKGETPYALIPFNLRESIHTIPREAINASTVLYCQKFDEFRATIADLTAQIEELKKGK